MTKRATTHNKKHRAESAKPDCAEASAGRFKQHNN